MKGKTPESATKRGRLCLRGLSGIMILYNPNRINVPLKRLDINPGWVEISGNEALEIVAEGLADIWYGNLRLFTGLW